MRPFFLNSLHKKYKNLFPIESLNKTTHGHL